MAVSWIASVWPNKRHQHRRSDRPSLPQLRRSWHWILRYKTPIKTTIIGIIIVTSYCWNDKVPFFRSELISLWLNLKLTFGCFSAAINEITWVWFFENYWLLVYDVPLRSTSLTKRRPTEYIHCKKRNRFNKSAPWNEQPSWNQLELFIAFFTIQNNCFDLTISVSLC